MRNRGVSSPMPFLLIPSSLLRGGFIINKIHFDTIIAIGGGTAMDMAKLISVLSTQNDSPIEYIKKEKFMRNPRRQKLILIPTTAGTGSEMTTFAVVYIGITKYSLDHQFLMSDYSIIDLYLTWSMPPYITASTGLDALSQAMESYWCVKSTEESREYASQSMKLILDNLEVTCKNPTKKSRANMSKAAMLAGKAINITRTTAAHAISYPLTSYFRVPHGHACGLTLPHFMLYNTAVTEKDVSDERGVIFVKERLNDILNILHVETPQHGCEKILLLMKNIGLETHLRALNIQKEDIEMIIANSFNPDRVSNNPRLLTEENLRSILNNIL